MPGNYISLHARVISRLRYDIDGSLTYNTFFMRSLFLSLLSLLCMTGFSQTKKIAFKSHSGSAENFSIALENDLFDMDNSNFGNPPDRYLDSVILIEDSVAVLVSRQEPFENAKARRDTLRSQPLFMKGNKVDSIRKRVRSITWFNNHVDSIKFIGFDVTKQKSKRNELPLGNITNNNNNRSFDGQVVLIAGLLLVLSLLAGLISWRLYDQKPAYQSLSV